MNMMAHVERMLSARSVAELFLRFEASMLEFGFDRILLALLNDHPRLNQTAQHGILKNYPDDWISHYFQQGYDKIDPVKLNASTQLLTFSWDSLKKSSDITGTQLRMFSEAEEAGLLNGIGVPLYGPGGANAGIGLASSNKNIDFDASQLPIVHVLCMQFYACYWRLQEQQATIEPVLSLREIEVLQWLAAGFTKADTGDKLNISTHTVDFHTRSILSKLGVRNIASAIYFSTSRGLIPAI
jgi:LuxR family transcriptional activator of conjugal transfer of Ti plasmids